jgi:hypothetical protein
VNRSLPISVTLAWLRGLVLPLTGGEISTSGTPRLEVAQPRAPGSISERTATGHTFYALPIQQLLALYGLNRWGMPIYVALVLAGTLPVAFSS